MNAKLLTVGNIPHQGIALAGPQSCPFLFWMPTARPGYHLYYDVLNGFL